MKRKLRLPLLVLMALLFAIQIHAADAPRSEKIVYGTSGEGRELVAYRYGSGENVLIMGFAIHGYEDNFDRDGDALVYTAQQVMAHLEGSYLPDSRNWTVYILPCMNPDGLYSGWTKDGPGRCTTTYLSNGKLIKGSGKGIDMNRCFPTRFSALYNARNYTTSQPMACLEAQALSDFIQEVKGSKVNVLIDVHGWYEQTITTSTRISTVLDKNFPDNIRTNNDGGTGYLITYAHELGYESALLELPEDNHSMSQYKSSGCVDKIIACVDGLICTEPRVCDQKGHSYITETTAATCTTNGKTVKTCKVCGVSSTTTLKAAGHDYTTQTTAPTCTANGKTVKSCSRCGISSTTVIPAAGHSVLADSIVTMEFPTACREGTYTYTCAQCGQKDLTGHIPSQFSDVRGDLFYSDALDWSYYSGYIKGTGETTFSPNGSLTRAMLVTILYRYHGSPSVSGSTAFADVPEDAYYTGPVCWAYRTGIVEGVSDTRFDPDAPVTREQAMTIFLRYVQYLGRDNGLRWELYFSDLDELDDYAAEAAAWSVANGIILGDDANRLLPRGSATRAQSVTILCRLDAYLNDATDMESPT